MQKNTQAKEINFCWLHVGARSSLLDEDTERTLVKTGATMNGNVEPMAKHGWPQLDLLGCALVDVNITYESFA